MYSRIDKRVTATRNQPSTSGKCRARLEAAKNENSGVPAAREWNCRTFRTCGLSFQPTSLCCGCGPREARLASASATCGGSCMTARVSSLSNSSCGGFVSTNAQAWSRNFLCFGVRSTKALTGCWRRGSMQAANPSGASWQNTSGMAVI